MKTILLLVALVSTKLIALENLNAWGIGNIIQAWPNPNVIQNNKPIKEYAIDMGKKQGLEAGQSVKVYRHLPIISPYSTGPWEMVKVYIGELQVIQASEQTAVARMNVGPDLLRIPNIDYEFFLIGDMVEIRSE
jgi:hypothetical protein